MLQIGNTSMMRASREGQLDVMKYLVEECKADVNVSDKVRQPTESNMLPGWFGG